MTAAEINSILVRAGFAVSLLTTHRKSLEEVFLDLDQSGAPRNGVRAMTALARVLRTESLKLKRTIAWKMVFLAPAAVVLLVMFMAVNAPFSMAMRGGTGREWAGLAHVTYLFWAALMMPLYITLQCALVAGVDHAENQWKSLFARPAPRWTRYAAKLIVVATMLAVSSIVLLCGMLVAAVILPWLQPELAFRFPPPWASLQLHALQIAGLAFLALAIQHFVSLRWRSFSVAMGVGIVATVVGYVTTVSTNAPRLAAVFSMVASDVGVVKTSAGYSGRALN